MILLKCKTDENEDSNAGSEEKDELFSQAVSLIKSEGKLPTSFLQENCK